MFESATFLVIAPFAVLFAGISKAGFGSGAAFASSTLLALILPPTQALGLMLPLLMLIDATTLRPFWKRWSWPDCKTLIVGAVPGVIGGVLLFRHANDDVLRILIGSVSIGFVAWQFRPQHVGRSGMPVRAGYLAGAVAGFTSFVSHAGGPPAGVYLLGRGLDKTTYQASTVLVFWVINILKFVPYAFLGVFTLQTAWAGFLLAPFAILGAWIGVKAHYAVSERVFFGLTYMLLTLTGAKLIWDALH